MYLRRILLYPVAMGYGLVMRLRNLMFGRGLLPSMEHGLPVISVGNLAAGGTGKTPHVEYLIRLLRGKYELATLSRGYGRSTRGYRLAGPGDDHSTIGDEPLQYRNKFPEVVVAVSERRNTGVEALTRLPGPPEVVLLDDAFQHRSLRPGLSILLTDYHSLYTRDYILPAGYLREPRTAARRADILIVTKTPEVLSPITRRDIAAELKPEAHQQLYFTHITYDAPVPLTPEATGMNLKEVTAVFLLAGIANPYPLEEHLRRTVDLVLTYQYPDHYNYREKDIQLLARAFHDHLARKKVLLTTEKDAMRLGQANLLSLLQGIPVAYVPIRVSFHGEDGRDFDERILRYVEQNKRMP